MKPQQKSPAADLDALIPILIGVWRRFHKLPGPPEKLQTREFRSVIEHLKVLQERFSEGKSLIGQDYFKDPQLLGAYLLYPWIIHYLEGLSVIGELPHPPKRVLELCSGPAPLAFAALRHGAQEAIAIDKNSSALMLGAEVCGRYGMPLTIRQGNCLGSRLPVEGKFDLVIVSYCLEELFPSIKKGWEEEQGKYLDHLLRNWVAPEGFLLILDSSYGEANRRVLQIRDRFAKEGVPIQAPCVWRGECPALKTANSPCYAQREFEKPYFIKEIQRASSINLSSLKMSYLIVRHPDASWPCTEDKPLYRVISPPVDSFNGKRFYLCGTDGKKHLGSRLKEHPIESRAFEYLRRGELISIERALEKQQAMDIIQETSVRVVAACGKPFSE